jgi:hypothetical protein
MLIVRQVWAILASVCIAAALAVAVPQFGGCAAGTNSLGSVLLAPDLDTFNKKLGAALTLNTAIRRASVTLMDANKISSQDGENVMAANDAAKAGLDLAATMSKIDLNAADGKLTAVNATLVALEAYLTSRRQ